MHYAPLALFVYNRADHFLQTYQALTACPEAKHTELYIFADGAKNPEGLPKVEAVRSAIRKIQDAGDFRAVHVQAQTENRGLAASIISGVSQVLEKEGRVIVLEDDCVASPHFLHYMNACLAFFENDAEIGAISGYCPRIALPAAYKEDVFLASRSCSWSWATWRDRWQDVDWKLAHIRDFYEDKALRRRLNANGSDRFLRLYRQTKPGANSWSVRFGAHLVRKNQLTVYPRYSYIQNIGCDASGVHSEAKDAKKMQTDLSHAIPDPDIHAVELDARIQKRMKKHYSYGFLSEVKRYINTQKILRKERRR